ncbi:EAL and HDOD domain-containing protein [Amphritea japonica]|uniref:Signal transduction protein n=1 Tax=Amphritea japonica ATCC BAA-1530 TaxID=1278309 RepID=A0A7R6PAZ1_9GAMM|nr:HDOD domain-containing protein [Amphritea japonica]BBB26662.1 signal transduction protein [Amphritea japonica ATCC BAA-1530]
MAQDILMARQPIYDQHLNVVAYELLYRSKDSLQNNLIEDGNSATSQVLLNNYTSIYQSGKLTKLPAFINLTKEMVKSDQIPELSRQHIVLEILEGMEVDDELISGVQRFVDEGYKVALDDFIYSPEYDPIIRMAHIVKLDILEMTDEELVRHVKILKPFGVTLLAEKIETQAEFERCHALGFKLFQGYFLCRPQLVQGKQLNSNEIVMVELMSALADPNVTPASIERIVKKDPQLTFRILRIVNSSFYNLIRKIDSLEEAIVLLGISEVKRWCALIAFSDQNGKPEELTRHTLVRARMCEILAEESDGMSGSTAFMMGVVSGLDALLDIPIEDILEQVFLTEEIELAILMGEGNYGQLLTNVDNLIQGRWNHLSALQTEQALSESYINSLQWVTEISEKMI